MTAPRAAAARPVALAVLAVLLAACSRPAYPGTPLESAVPSPQGDLLVGTTTTTQDTGLLDVLIPAFEKRTGWKVKLVVGGSGQVLAQGARGDLDVLLTHSPAAEEAFVAAGNGVDRRLVMHNDFVLMGPASDPAQVKGLPISDALRRIFDRGVPFISRGDQSGTNVKELDLWKAAGRDPKGRPWYIESGVGQLQNLQLALTRNAYTLSDRGTFVANRALLDGLVVLVEHGRDLLNIYHVTTVNPQRYPRVRAAGATVFADYLTSPDGQALIASYGVQKYGAATFTADAGKSEDSLQ